jgi:hypothetical protein
MILQIEPKHVRALEVYAIVLRRLRRYDEAMKVKGSIPVEKPAHQHELTAQNLKSSASSHDTSRKTSTAEASEVSDKIGKFRNHSNKLLHLSLRSIASNDDPKSARSRSSRNSMRSSHDGEDSDRSHQDGNKTIKIDISEPRGSNLSLKERKLVSRIKGKLENEDEEYIESLTAFKLLNGFKTSLFETLFVKPDVLQESLLIPPARRSLNDIEVIGTNLRLVHLFRDLSDGVVTELASKIEYRTVLPKVEIYSQNQPCDSFCIVLKGSVQVKMDGEVKGTKDIIIGPELGPGDVIGHIDLLFQQSESNFMNELRRRIKDNEVGANTKKTSNHEDDGIVIRGHQEIHAAHHHNNNKEESRVHRFANKDNTLSKSFAAALISDTHPSKHMLSRRQSRLMIGDPGPPPILQRLNSGETLNSRAGSIVGSIQSTTKAVGKITPHGTLKATSSKNALNEKSTTSSQGTGGDSNGPMASKNHRSLAAGMFATYTTQSYSEVLLINDRDYFKLLLNLCINDFKKRYDVLKASGVFFGWSDYDLIRIARMGRIRSYKQGDVIIAQKEKPMHLFFMLNGLCKNYKRPNRIEVVERKLAEAKAKAERYDLKYSYHHDLRKDVKHVDVVEVLSSSRNHRLSNVRRPFTSDASSFTGRHLDSASCFGMNHTSVDLSDYQQEDSPSRVITADITSHITQSEAERYELEVEIKQLELLHQKLLATAGGVNARPSTATKTIDISAVDDSICELTTLKWPMMFGEESILEPDIGASRGSIVATTICDVFMVHKSQIQTFHISDSFLSKLREHAIVFPEDDALVDTMIKNKAWKAYRQNIVKNLPKNRWPKQGSKFDPFI